MGIPALRSPDVASNRFVDVLLRVFLLRTYHPGVDRPNRGVLANRQDKQSESFGLTSCLLSGTRPSRTVLPMPSIDNAELHAGRRWIVSPECVAYVPRS